MFAPGSRAEVPIVGRLEARRRAADCGRPARSTAGGDARFGADRRLQDRPRRAGRLDEVAAYVTQLALYRAVLARFTRKDDSGRTDFHGRAGFMEFAAELMDAALADIMRKVDAA